MTEVNPSSTLRKEAAAGEAAGWLHHRWVVAAEEAEGWAEEHRSWAACSRVGCPS